MFSQILAPSFLDQTDYPNPLYQNFDEKDWNGHEVKKIEESTMITDSRGILISNQIVIPSLLNNSTEYSNPLYEDFGVWNSHEVKNIEVTETTPEQIDLLLKKIEGSIHCLSFVNTNLINDCQQLQLDLTTLSLLSPGLYNAENVFAARDDFIDTKPSDYNEIDMASIKFAITYIATQLDQECLSYIKKMKKIITNIYNLSLLNNPKKSLEIAKVCLLFDSDLTNEISLRCYFDLINDEPILAWKFVKMIVGKKNNTSKTILEHALYFLFMDISENIFPSTIDFLVNYLQDRLGISLDSDQKINLEKISSTLTKCKKIKTENDALKIIENQVNDKSETFLMIVEMARSACEVKEIKFTKNWEKISFAS